MKKDVKNRWKYRLGKLMSVMLAATTLGGSIDAKALAGGSVDAGVLAEHAAGETASSELSSSSTGIPKRDSISTGILSDSDISKLSDLQTKTHETSEAESNKALEATSEAESDKAEVTSEAESDKAAEPSKSTETETETESSETPEVTGTPETSQTPEINAGTILEILNSDALSALDPVVVVQNTSDNNDALLMRILQLQSVSARVRTADGEETTIRLSVDWNVGRLDLPQIDVSVAGEYEELGTIVFPDGYACADHILRTLRLPVHVVLPDSPVVLTKIDAWTAEGEAYAIATGSDLSAFISTNLPGLWSCYDASHTLYQADICWNADSVNTTTPGLYWLTGTLAAPAHTAFSETLAVPVLRVPVSVQDPKHPDINFIFPARGKLCIPIAGLPGDPAQIRIRLCTRDGIWQDITDSGDCQISSDAIYLSNFLFTPQETYKLQVTYEGGKTGILTFLFDETLEHFQYSGGDRDGGDSGTGKEDDRIQPAPELPETEQTEPQLPETEQTESELPETFQTETNLTETKTPESSTQPSEPFRPSAAEQTEANLKSNQSSGQTEANSKSNQNSDRTEHFTSDYDRISGTRLLLTLDTAGCAQFSKHGISISVPEAALHALSIACEDFFRITILQASDDTFSFFFEKNETVIPTLPGVQIMLPWSGDDKYGLLLLDEQRCIISYGSCDPNSHIASFVTDQTGTFQIVPDDGTVSTLVRLIDDCRSSFLQQVSRYFFWLLSI